jgi:phosphoribosyl-ATP pyrophosphohydrolase
MHAGPRDNSYITEEWKQKMKQIQKKLHDEGICTGRAATEEKELERRKKIAETLRNRSKNKSKK